MRGRFGLRVETPTRGNVLRRFVRLLAAGDRGTLEVGVGDIHVVPHRHGRRDKDSPVNGTSAPVFRLMGDS